MIDIDQEQVRQFKESGVFDERWYLDTYPDVRQSGIDPALHYIWLGKRLGRQPSPNYDSRLHAPETKQHVTRSQDNLFESAWSNSFAVAQGARSPDFAPRALTPAKKDPGSPLLAAFYLPQFHPIKENDEWWGTGFTEWTNVSKAVPQFAGHYQPRLPLDLGFYDLRNIDVMRAQVELAKTNGIDAFCFHYYWFDSKRLLEKPIEAYLADGGKTLDLPFFLCWANENWTRRWDGAEADILMEQSHSLDDHAKVFKDLVRYLTDSRYVKINGKPIIVIYRPDIIKDLAAMVSIWRAAAKDAGLPGIHLVATNSFGFSDPDSIGFDALCEFPPHNVVAAERNFEKQWYNSAHEGRVYAYPEVVDYCTARLHKTDGTQSAKNYYPTVMMGWDNEARKPGKSSIFDGFSPLELHRWLSASVDFSARNHAPGEGLVFVNAWNEWAEGTYLEPDRKLGHANLWAVRAVLEERKEPDAALKDIVARANAASGPRSSDGAICLHLFYPDLIDEIAELLHQVHQQDQNLDLLISIPASWDKKNLEKAIAIFNPKRVFLVENRGRDVLPFLQVARAATNMGYVYGCKIHSKKSAHVKGGERWRTSIYSALLAPDRVKSAVETFRQFDRCGIYAPHSMLKSCDDPATMRDNLESLDRIFAETGGSIRSLRSFVAGTMFWFRFDAIQPALNPRFGADWFGPELGAIDGTMAHAFERAMVYFCEAAGYELMASSDNVFDPYS